MQYGRGCRYACDFCSIHAFYGTSLRYRPVPEVVAEIEVINRKHVFLVDDNFFVDVPKAEELFPGVGPFADPLVVPGHIDVAQDVRLLVADGAKRLPDRVGRFRVAGRTQLAADEEAAGISSTGDYATAVRKFQDHGIMIYGTFVFGYDQDTVDSFASPRICPAIELLPGQLQSADAHARGRLSDDRLRGEGRLIHDRWWLDGRFAMARRRSIPGE